jgi:bile acid:Na+ symporter, BASS family
MRINLNPAVQIALVTLAVSPVPPIFPKKAMKDGGGENYTIGLLVAVSILSIAVIPLTMAILNRVGTVPVPMSAATVASLVFTTILAPLLAGIVIRALVPVAETWADQIGRLANILLVLAVIPVLLMSAKSMLSLVGDGTLVSFIVFAVVGFVIGHLLGGPKPENRRVLGLATATRHPGMAVAIAHLNFPQQKLATPAIALYLIISAIVAALASGKQKPADQAPTQMTRRMAA